MRKLKISLAALMLLFASGCRKEIYVPVEKVTIVRDTIDRRVASADTVIMADSVLLLQRGDTVIKEVWRKRDRISLRHDTIRIVRCDTIREERPVEVVVERKSKSGWWPMAILLLAGIVAILIRNRKK